MTRIQWWREYSSDENTVVTRIQWWREYSGDENNTYEQSGTVFNFSTKVCKSLQNYKKVNPTCSLLQWFDFFKYLACSLPLQRCKGTVDSPPCKFLTWWRRPFAINTAGSKSLVLRYRVAHKTWDCKDDPDC